MILNKRGAIDFEKIKQTVKEIRFDTLRFDSDNKFEAVIVNEETGRLMACLESFFGKPEFPSKNRLSAQILETIDEFGGIMPGQALYYWSQGIETIFAMLWPWKDGQHTTVKIIKK